MNRYSANWVPTRFDRVIGSIQDNINGIITGALLGLIAVMILLLCETSDQHRVESLVVGKSDPTAARLVEKRDQFMLPKVSVEIRTEERLGAAASDDKPAELQYLTIIEEKPHSGPLHGAEPVTRLILIGSRTAVMDVTLRDIMDQLTTVPKPLGDPADSGPQKH